jgi:hypothetical protein
VGSNTLAQSNVPETDFAARVLRAVALMAARSYRREADLAAALRAADIPIDMDLVRPALRSPRGRGCISNLVALSDGGLPLTVTGIRVDQPDQTSPWFLDDDHVIPMLGVSSMPAA